MAQCSEPIEPQYTTDEKSDLATLRVSCYIPSLTVSRKFTAKKLIPKIVKQAENAEIKANFQEDCFSVTVTGNTPSVFKGKVYELKIRKLPKLIIPGESSYQVKEDRVVILLRKKVVESWYPELEEGLDAYEEPSDEDDNIEIKQIEETPKDKIKCETVAEKKEDSEKG